MSDSLPIGRRWPGVVLSLLVPGFGLVRAGRVRRGIVWFIALQVSVIIAAGCAVLSAVPAWLAVAAMVAQLIAHLWMLCDSFRPGRMRMPHWLVFGGVFAALAFLLPVPALLIAGSYRITTSAMEPTLRGKQPDSPPDLVLANRLSYRFGAPQRGDLIVFGTSAIRGIIRQPNSTGAEMIFVKRLIGLPGERIRIADGKIFADGRLLGEADGIPNLPYLPGNGKAEFVVGPKEFFVLGDYSANSYDSRYWGGVPTSAVIGKVTMICYPLQRIGRIPPAGQDE
jgi:signal peptidase I